jgi:NADH-quinone oxidoreductase subunit G
VVGIDRVGAQLGDGLPAEVVLSLPRATIDQAASADTVIVLSGDLREELPILFLRLRSGIVDGQVSVVELSPRATSVTPYAAVSLRYRPGGATELVRALCDPSAGVAGVDPVDLATARGMTGAGKVVVVIGRPSLAEDGRLVAEAAQLLAAALPAATFLPALRRGNVMGALDMGLAPGLLPGRVGLEAGRSWFTQAWGSVPAVVGRDTTAMLRSAAGDSDDEHPVAALVVLGAEPLVDHPDADLARRGLEGAGFVLAVASTPGPLTELADVVLPAAEAHERPGTTTNIEGRISRLGQKLVQPGQSWPDWMIAAELAASLDADLHLDSVAEVWDEIERVAPAYQGITRAILDGSPGTDGVVAPLRSSPVTLVRRTAALLDPIAVPGVESVERQGAPPRAGLAESPTAGLGTDTGADAGSGTSDTSATSGKSDSEGSFGSEGGIRSEGTSGQMPPVLSGPVDLAVPHVTPTDSYSLRLVASRRLYDRGAAVSASPALAGLVEDAPVRVNPHDLDDLGVAAGGLVRLRTARASLVVAAVPDATLPRKVVVTDFNVALAGGSVSGSQAEGSSVADLIDCTAPVTELRLETS